MTKEVNFKVYLPFSTLKDTHLVVRKMIVYLPGLAFISLRLKVTIVAKLRILSRNTCERK